MARTSATKRKRREVDDVTIENATSRQQILDDRLANDDSRANNVGRKRQRTADETGRPIAILDIVPRELRKMVQVEMRKSNIPIIAALHRFTQPGKSYRKSAQALYKTWCPTSIDGQESPPKSESEDSEGDLDLDLQLGSDDDDVSVGEVAPADDGKVATRKLRSMSITDSHISAPPKTGERVFSGPKVRIKVAVPEDDGVRDLTLQDIEPHQLRSHVKLQAEADGLSVFDALVRFMHSGQGHTKLAKKLHSKWAPRYRDKEASTTVAANAKLANGHSEVSMSPDSDNERSVGEVTPIVEDHVKSNAEPQDMSPDVGQPQMGFWRLQDLSDEQQRLQTKYFNLSHPGAFALCLSCGEAGHVDSLCPAQNCKHCGRQHFTRSCPTSRKCDKCRQRGHAVAECTRRPVPGGGPTDPCDICEKVGHVEEMCEGLWRSMGKIDSEITQKRIPAKSMRKACYNCGSSSHWGDDCVDLPNFIKRLGKGTWSAQHAEKYFSPDGEIELLGFGATGGPSQMHHPQAYQLAQFDDY